MTDPATTTEGLQGDGQGHNSGLLRYRHDAIADHAAVTVDAFVEQMPHVASGRRAMQARAVRDQDA